MKVTIELELTKQQATLVATNSIKRFMNNVIEVGSSVSSVSSVTSGPSYLKERASSLWQDAEVLKETTDYIWNEIRNQLFKDKLI